MITNWNIAGIANAVQVTIRHEICQKINTTGFFGRKLYTLKVHVLRLFLLTIKHCKCINIRNLGPFLFNYTKCVKIQRFKSKITLGLCKFCSSTQFMQEKMLFSWKIYIAGTNLTRPPVVTVAKNHTSGHYLIVNHYSSMSWFKFHNSSVIVNCVTKSL